MADAQQALDAMTAAEDEARTAIDIAQRTNDPAIVVLSVWACDRVRLIERDRNTLELHAATDYGDGKLASCEVCGVHSPCHDLAAVIRYWCHDEETP